ncbi:MAG: hypothetical protein Q7T28_10615 [Cypionkella sp.]|uniref:hypothetical protein n=1 Tax=Cypionkella sp. TaxID=2811411 RepID=UPI0027269BEC|nr:hypothetical protein [Cypionkella sp.]MDO8327376.1 hypothetical protein [Cypionkella sp.]
MTFTILTLTAAYAMVASLLAYLLLLSRLHWVFKALATLSVVALVPLTFFGVGELRGLPSDGNLPGSFRMLWAQVIEPNPLQGEKGHVFIWLQTLDRDNYPTGLPRAYQLPYSDDLQIKVNEALGKISQGEEIQGKVDARKALPEATSEALAQEIKTGLNEARPGGTSTVGERIMTFEPSMLTFTPEAAPITPTKPP